ncbi:MAG: hypothetical protein AAF004_11920, partial [Pseudomonadota bacterium]
TDAERAGQQRLIVHPVANEVSFGVQQQDHSVRLLPHVLNPLGIPLDLATAPVRKKKYQKLADSRSAALDSGSVDPDVVLLNIELVRALADSSSLVATVGAELPADEQSRRRLISAQLQRDPGATVVTLNVIANITNKMDQARVDVIQKVFRTCEADETPECLQEGPERVFSFISPRHKPRLASVEISDDDGVRVERRLMLSETWTPERLSKYFAMAVPQFVTMIQTDWRNENPRAPWKDEKKQFAWIDHKGRGIMTHGRLLDSTDTHNLYELHTRQYASLPDPSALQGKE